MKSPPPLPPPPPPVASCIAHFSRVCVAQPYWSLGRNGQRRAQSPIASPWLLTFDDTSLCNGQPCWKGHGWTMFAGKDAPLPLWKHGPFGGSNMYLFQRFPIAYMDRGTVGNVSQFSALLPSGLHAGNRITDPLANMNHMLRDHLLHEVDVLRSANISVILDGVARTARDAPLNLVHLLRERVLAAAGVRLAAPSERCFEHLYTYPWSCDRDLERYRRAGLASLRWLRRLAPAHASARTAPRTLVLYGRSDTRRRRLLNLSHHLAAFRARFEPERTVVLWDALWAARPPLRRQAEVIRGAETLVTPHGAWPSVWGLFLRPGAAIVEIFSACMATTWLPPHVVRRLRLRHIVLNRASLGRSRVLVDTRSGARVEGCVKWPHDPDILIEPPEALADKVAGALSRAQAARLS